MFRRSVVQRLAEGLDSVGDGEDVPRWSPQWNALWKTVLPPIVLVVAIWGLTSGATTYYLLWLDNSYDTAFAKNVQAIQAADSLQQIVWRVLLDYPTDRSAVESFRAHWPEASAALDRELANLDSDVLGPAEQEAIESLTVLLKRLRDRIEAVSWSAQDRQVAESEVNDRAVLRELGGTIATVTNKIRLLNHQMLEQAATKRKEIQGFVFVGRISLLFAGPALGMWLGWKLSRRLHTSVAQLAVTLRDASTQLEKQVASVELTSNRDLGDVQQQAIYVVSRIREVSQELDSARREVLQAERLAAVGELSAGIAHELRNPLTSIKLLLQHAGRQVGDITLRENKLQLILEEIFKMEATIQGLLDFSRPPVQNRACHDLKPTLNRALNLITGRVRQQQIDVSSIVCEEPILVHGNEEQLQQVLVNLLINAIDAMPQGGSLNLNAGHSHDENWVRVEVADSGTGFSEQILNRLFQPFVTSKEKGTGLGLAISYRIIHAHGGKIRAANRTDRGAVLVVELPAARASTDAADYWGNHKSQPTLVGQ